MVQTADSALNNVQSMLQRVSELAVQYQNGDLSSSDKTDIQNEVNQLTQEIDRQQGSVQFNGINLLNGSAGSDTGAVTFQVGPRASDTLTVSFANIEGTGTWTAASGSPLANAATGGQVFDLSQTNAVSLVSAPSTTSRRSRRRWARSRTVSSTPRMPSRRRRRTCPRR